MSNELAVRYEVSNGEQIKLDKNYVQKYLLTGNGAITDAEALRFMTQCQAAGANPAAGEAIIQKWGNQGASTIFTAKFFMYVVQSQPDYDGMEHGIIVATQGGVQERQGTIIAANEQLLGAWCRIWSKSRSHPTYVDVAYSEVVQYNKSGQPNAVWSKQPARMCEKCAQVKAAREFCPSKLGHAYIREEMPAEDRPAPKPAPTPVQSPVQHPDYLAPVRDVIKQYCAVRRVDMQHAMAEIAEAVGAASVPAMTPEQAQQAAQIMSQSISEALAAQEPVEADDGEWEDA